MMAAQNGVTYGGTLTANPPAGSTDLGKKKAKKRLVTGASVWRPVPSLKQCNLPVCFIAEQSLIYLPGGSVDFAK